MCYFWNRGTDPPQDLFRKRFQSSLVSNDKINIILNIADKRNDEAYPCLESHPFWWNIGGLIKKSSPTLFGWTGNRIAWDKIFWTVFSFFPGHTHTLSLFFGENLASNFLFLLSNLQSWLLCYDWTGIYNIRRWKLQFPNHILYEKLPWHTPETELFHTLHKIVKKKRIKKSSLMIWINHVEM